MIQSIEDWTTIVNELIDLAVYIAWMKKRKAILAKGRRLSARVWRQWLASTQARMEIINLLLLSIEIAEEMPKAGLGNQNALSVARLELTERLNEMNRTKGRPRRRAIDMGIISSARNGGNARKPIRLSGRPLKVTLLQEKKWLDTVQNMKAILFGMQHGYRHWNDLENHLSRDPHLAEEINQAISDSEAIRRVEEIKADLSGETFDLARMRALKARYSRAKKLFLHLPKLPDSVKSGG